MSPSAVRSMPGRDDVARVLRPLVLGEGPDNAVMSSRSDQKQQYAPMSSSSPSRP